MPFVYHATLNNVLSWLVSCHVMSCQVMSCVTPRHVTSHHITSHHIIYHIISYHIKYHIILRLQKCFRFTIAAEGIWMISSIATILQHWWHVDDKNYRLGGRQVHVHIKRRHLACVQMAIHNSVRRMIYEGMTHRVGSLQYVSVLLSLSLCNAFYAFHLHTC